MFVALTTLSISPRCFLSRSTFPLSSTGSSFSLSSIGEVSQACSAIGDLCSGSKSLKCLSMCLRSHVQTPKCCGAARIRAFTIPGVSHASALRRWSRSGTNISTLLNLSYPRSVFSDWQVRSRGSKYSYRHTPFFMNDIQGTAHRTPVQEGLNDIRNFFVAPWLSYCGIKGAMSFQKLIRE